VESVEESHPQARGIATMENVTAFWSIDEHCFTPTKSGLAA